MEQLLAIVHAEPMALQDLVEAGSSVLQMMAIYALLDLQCLTGQDERGVVEPDSCMRTGSSLHIDHSPPG